MFDSLFTSKCTAFTGSNGRALTGDALAAAETAFAKAKESNLKVWTDRNGFIKIKRRSIFSSARPLVDSMNNPVRVCGRSVRHGAKFCSKCGSPAPGSWWKCSGCGKSIGIESQTCPHCGKVQTPSFRLDIANGSWQKNENIFAQRFDAADILPLISNGLNLQLSQAALVLRGGTVEKILESGFHTAESIIGSDKETGDCSLVMVDRAEFTLPICVESVRTSDELACDFHTVAVLQFDPEQADNFMRNLMGSSLYLNNEEITSALAYDEIAHCILQNIDGGAREIVNKLSADDLFKNPAVKQEIEDYLSNSLKKNLSSIGIKFVRLNELEFESETMDKLRDMSGAISGKAREIDLKQKSDKLANDAVRLEAANEYEIDDYMKQLAHENALKDELRAQEEALLKARRAQKLEKGDLSHENDLDDLQQNRQLGRDRIDAEFEQDILDLQKKRELNRSESEKISDLEKTKIDSKIQEIQIDVEQKKVAAEQQSTEKWLDIKMKKQSFNQEQKLNMIKALSGADLQAILAVEDDPAKRQDLLKLYEQQMQAAMTPELVLAAAAARGNTAAADAIAKLSQEKADAILKAKNENKEIFEEMLKMNERMFNQTVENIANRNSDGSQKFFINTK